MWYADDKVPLINNPSLAWARSSRVFQNSSLVCVHTPRQPDTRRDGRRMFIAWLTCMPTCRRTSLLQRKVRLGSNAAFQPPLSNHRPTASCTPRLSSQRQPSTDSTPVLVWLPSCGPVHPAALALHSPYAMPCHADAVCPHASVSEQLDRSTRRGYIVQRTDTDLVLVIVMRGRQHIVQASTTVQFILW